MSSISRSSNLRKDRELLSTKIIPPLSLLSDSLSFSWGKFFHGILLAFLLLSPSRQNPIPLETNKIFFNLEETFYLGRNPFCDESRVYYLLVKGIPDFIQLILKHSKSRIFLGASIVLCGDKPPQILNLFQDQIIQLDGRNSQLDRTNTISSVQNLTPDILDFHPIGDRIYFFHINHS